MAHRAMWQRSDTRTQALVLNGILGTCNTTPSLCLAWRTCSQSSQAEGGDKQRNLSQRIPKPGGDQHCPGNAQTLGCLARSRALWQPRVRAVVADTSTAGLASHGVALALSHRLQKERKEGER